MIPTTMLLIEQEELRAELEAIKARNPRHGINHSIRARQIRNRLATIEDMIDDPERYDPTTGDLQL